MKLVLAYVAPVVALAGCSRGGDHMTVGAAPVMRHAMPELVAGFGRNGGVDVEVTYAASDELAAQAARGVRLDVVVVADPATLDRMVDANHVVADSRRELATSSIVLVGPPGSRARFASLDELPTDAKIAIGDPATVPAGRYAKQYLETLGAWQPIQPRLVLGGDVAGVLGLAKSGKAHAAVVYESDARDAAPLVVLDQPTDAPIASVSAGIGAHSRHAAAAERLLDFLQSHDGRVVLARHGFAPPRE